MLKNSLVYMLAAALMMTVIGAGFSEAVSASGNIQILKSDYAVVDRKMKVTVDVYNSGSGSQGGAVAIGKDEQGNPIEIKGKSQYMSKNSTAVFEILLDSGASVKSVEVLPTGNKIDVALLGYGSRINGDYLEVTGAVENGQSGQTAGIVVFGLDKQGRTVEVKGAHAYISNGSVGNFNVQLKRKELIHTVKVEATGDANAITLLGFGQTVISGKTVVTASVENGGSGRPVGVVFEGYDSNGKLLEVKAAHQYLAKQSVGNYEVTLQAGSQISTVKAFATGKASHLELLSFGSRLVDGKWSVTSVIENGESGLTAGAVVQGFDARGRLVEVRAANQYLSSQSTGNFERVLLAGNQVKKIQVRAAGGYQVPKAWGYGIYQANGRNFVTTAVTNGSKGQTITVKVTPYNARGKSMSVKTSKKYISANGTSEFQIALDGGSAHASVTMYDENGQVVTMPSVSGIDVEIDGVLQSYEQPPVNLGGSILVPMRSIFEALGSEIKWNGATRSVTSEKNGVVIKLTIDSKVATIQGKQITLNTAPTIVNQATMVPIRFVSEALGADVIWDADSSTVRITTKK
ncbi:stalk domain-containing protein [Paenibacillus tarimensis]|uniref:stalk domain-containing protein n=1 Tax=Paenibacillus tarimensis TaxID=416012 RepID=UPI001F3CE50F|nr:stalk domain-containing protein [Paenibacillus tarimensis]MCF2942998.1 copper amine oxidase N-terminal domain-containing protein [Paenibacillus tarimensis]